MLESDNWYSNGINSGVEYLLGLGGYDTTRRGEQGNGTATGAGSADNSFYRDNADWMPGWGNTFGLGFLDPNGHPSGATAQDRATNYVGASGPVPGSGVVPSTPQSDPTGIWGAVRQNLVTTESADIAAARARGDTNITFGEVYDAHVNAYHDAQVTHGLPHGNTFIDPASFGLAMYGAPLMEHFGINAGPITGASIDLFNDPTDSVEDGWAKRMALAGGEEVAGLGLMGMAATDIATGNPLDAAVEAAGGVGMMGLGAFTGIYNTVTAVENGMTPSGAVSGIGHVGSGLARAGGQMLSDAGDAISDAGSSVLDSGASLVDSATSGIAGIGSGAADAISSWWNDED